MFSDKLELTIVVFLIPRLGFLITFQLGLLETMCHFTQKVWSWSKNWGRGLESIAP